jgi:hypothetical protein
LRWPIAIVGLGLGCNPVPEAPTEGVEFRAGTDGATSGERGNIKIAEILWSGSVTNDGVRDATDVFVEIRNEGAQPVNMSNWYLELEGTIETAFRFPASDFVLEVNEQAVAVTKTTGCFPNAEWVIPELRFPDGDPFELTILDSDEHLGENAGNETAPPYAGGFDGVVSRSMERINLMFGARGSTPHAWHYYAESLCSDAYYAEDPEGRAGHFCSSDEGISSDISNNDLVAPECRQLTMASPGRANSPDYSGAYASGSFE